jgi:hypothetical protein
MHLYYGTNKNLRLNEIHACCVFQSTPQSESDTDFYVMNKTSIRSIFNDSKEPSHQTWDLVEGPHPRYRMILGFNPSTQL